MRKITIVESSDWFGLYLNGSLVYENHTIEPGYLLKRTGVKHDRLYIDEQDMFKMKFLPSTLEELLEKHNEDKV